MSRNTDLTKVSVFEGKRVRKVFHAGQWWFSIVDTVEVLVENERPRKYWNDLKKKLIVEGYIEVSDKIGQLKMRASDGKLYLTDCASTETLFRIIQSIPSPKAEPFKRWLARVGRERIEEIRDPELAMDRVRAIYAKKGYSREWVEKRIRGIAIRQDLTQEWKDRGAARQRDYAILTNEIMQGAFGLKVDTYKKVKGLDRENLRDHMTDMELILTMLGEATTTTLTRGRGSRGMPALEKDAGDGGGVAGRTRRDIEKVSGQAVVSGENFLGQGEAKKRKGERVKEGRRLLKARI
ncbi:MAG: Bro-N domain-containing protein [Elusimicrobia bacterium]|nr:Bro-N domain-containing protein [Elusimicrobiota bacterium]